MHYFTIVSRDNHLLYETNFTNNPQSDDTGFLKQYVTFAALDLIEELQWRTQNMFLRCVDRWEQWFVSGFISASQTKFLLVHDGLNEDAIKYFFIGVMELYIKFVMNPFYEDGMRIVSERFDKRVQVCGKKYLGD